MNGSFETATPGLDGGQGRQVYVVGQHNTAIQGWTLSGGGDVYLHISPDIGNAIGINFNDAQSGNTYLDLSGGIGGGVSGNHATIYQDFATVPLAAYQLTFFIGAANSPFSSINVRVDGASSLVNETLIAQAHAQNSKIVWTQNSFTFVANSAVTRLSFHDTSTFDDNVSFVDNVSITELSTVATPEPSSMALGLIAIAALTGRSARRRWFTCAR